MKMLLNKLYTRFLGKGIFAVMLIACLGVSAQQRSSTDASQVIEPGRDVESSEFVTINVRDANIAEVLKAYSLQTGQSIVVGPDVVSDNVNVRLNNIPWEEALDVILKPYGFGYRVVGDTIVISKLENIVTVEGIEPLVSKVFRLKYLDAYDIQAICEAQLSVRGKFTILSTKSLPGWEFGGSGSEGAATEAGIRRRKEKEEIRKSKLFVITDVPSAVSKVDRVLEQMDVIPKQILIEAKFMEISNEGAKSIGLDYISGMETIDRLGDEGELTPTPIDASADLFRVLNLTTGYADPLTAGAAASYEFSRGLRLSHSELLGHGADMVLSLMAQSDDVNVLSAPRILTVNNQEAAILVGEKFPIIKSESTTGGGSGITSTSLDYYENIGIQLNVIPQVCDDDYVNMIVHPAVSEIQSFESGVVTGDSGSQSGSRYPRLKIREAETQIMIKSESTAVIGGLQNERDVEQIKKIPLLGDIPFLGRLFRSESTTKTKVDLLIFIKASIIKRDAYAAASKEIEIERETVMDLDLFKTEDASDEEPAIMDESAPSDDEASEIIALVEGMETSSTNQVDAFQL